MMSSNSEDLDLQPYFETEITPFRIKKIVDIGGGTGNILIKLLKFYKNSFGILLDLQFVETEAIRNLQNYNMENRVKFYSGNFFEPIDFSADIFVMSRILHDWSDEEAIQGSFLSRILYKAGTSTASLSVCTTEYGDGDLTEFKPVARRHEAYVSAFMVFRVTNQ